MPQNITVIKKKNHPTIDFAAREIQKYLKKTGLKQKVQITLDIENYDDEDKISIKPLNNGYLISGSNPRSVLFAAYRFLAELGFKWLRPGRRGEIIPDIKKFKRNINVNERASYKYRTLCIEGAASLQHILDLIDWAAKNRMNGYFIQFDYGTYFFKRWYAHQDNPYMKPEKFDETDAKKFVEIIAKEVKKRGMRLEKMGHGWTCRALGIQGEG
ncbi:MAG: hypothetical protein ACP5QD_04045, partial [Candidatus Ratteibacteria bacterium]